MYVYIYMSVCLYLYEESKKEYRTCGKANGYFWRDSPLYQRAATLAFVDSTKCLWIFKATKRVVHQNQNPYL